MGPKRAGSSPPTLIICKTTNKEVETLHNILSTFEKASGLCVNFSKSKIFFRKNTQQSVKDNISSFLGVSKRLGTLKYLPSMIGRKKKAMFNCLRDRI